MTLHGQTTIQLYDAETGGLVEEHHDTNMVTHAIRDLLNLDPCGLREYSTMQSVFPIQPLCPNAIGGILVYPETLPEDADKYYAPPSNIPIGYAAAESYAGADPKRGQYNAKESGPLANGYKFVFDFPSDRGNGNIAALGLTSLRGGRSYFGSNYDYLLNNNAGTFPWWSIISTGTSMVQRDSKFGGWQSNKAFVALVPNQTTTQSGTPTTTPVTWITVPLRALDIGLTSIPGPTVDNDVTATLTLNGNYYQQWSGGKQYATTLWDSDKFYVIAYAGNASGNATIKLATINAGVVSERTLTVAAQLAGYDTSVLKGSAGISDGILYAWSYDGTGIYRINLANESDVTLLSLPSGMPARGVNNSNYYLPFMINPWSDGYLAVLYYNSDGSSYYSLLICDNKIIQIDYNYYQSYYNYYSNNNYIYSSYRTMHQFGPYTLMHHSYRNEELQLSVRTPYLATINNLAAAVTKTAAQTMKITYTLTES